MRFLNSVKSLYVAVGILFLTIGLGSYVDVRNEAMHAQHLEINTGLERMVRLNQELTNMLAIAVLKNSALGIASYDTVKHDLQQTMDQVTELTQAQNLLLETSSLSDSLKQFREIEGQAIQFITDEKWEEAAGILFGDDYMLARKTYEVDSETAVSAVMGELAITAQRFAQVKLTAFWLRIAALALLLWVGIMFSRKTRTDLAEQMRLREEITAAYEGMEARVQERTADLEKITKNLAAENEERIKSDQRTRLILNSADEGIFGVDVQEKVTFINEAATRLIGFAADEVLGQNIHPLIHHSHADGSPLQPDDCPMHLAFKTRKGQQVEGELLWRKDGSSFCSEYAVTLITDAQGQASGAVVVFRDISEKRSHQEELRQRMDELERFNRLTLGREERMIQLKQEINGLLEAQGLPRRYKDPDAAA